MAKGSVRKKARNGVTAIMWRMPVVTWFRRTTMNIYAHATREARRNSVRLLDKVAGND